MELKMTQALSLKIIGDEMEKQILPAKITYKLSKIFSAAKEHEQFYANEINKLIQEYGEKDEQGNLIPLKQEEGNGIKIKLDCINLFQTKVEGLLSLKVDFPNISFSLDELESVQLSLKDFNALLPFIKEE